MFRKGLGMTLIRPSQSLLIQSLIGSQQAMWHGGHFYSVPSKFESAC